MAKRTEEYYTDVCKKLNLDVPLFRVKELTQDDKDTMNFIDKYLLPYVQELATKYGFNEDDFTVTYATTPQSFTIWVTDNLDNTPAIITDIYKDGKINGDINKYESNTDNETKVNNFIDTHLDEIQEFIRHDLND